MSPNRHLLKRIFTSKKIRIHDIITISANDQQNEKARCKGHRGCHDDAVQHLQLIQQEVQFDVGRVIMLA